MARQKKKFSKYCTIHSWRNYLEIVGNNTLICKCQNCDSRINLKTYLKLKDNKKTVMRNLVSIKNSHIDLFWS